MAKIDKKVKKLKAKDLKQSTFSIPAFKTRVCEICNFTYSKNIKKSRDQHDTVHSEFLLGSQIRLKQQLQKLFSAENSKEIKLIILEGKRLKVHAVVLSCTDQSISTLVEETLTTMDKTWLNSTDCSSSWKSRPLESKVVLLIGEQERIFRIIGITITESPEPNSKYIPGLHLDTKTCEIVSEQPKLQLRLGVSRIFVLPAYRGHGLAKMMLDCVLKYCVYGTELNKWQIGFSQPSGAGLHLLKSWYNNSPTLPVYEEN